MKRIFAALLLGLAAAGAACAQEAGLWSLEVEKGAAGVYAVVSTPIPAAQLGSDPDGSLTAVLAFGEGAPVIRLDGLPAPEADLPCRVVVTDHLGEEHTLSGRMAAGTGEISLAEADGPALEGLLKAGGRAEFDLLFDTGAQVRFVIENADGFDSACKDRDELKGWAADGWFQG